MWQNKLTPTETKFMQDIVDQVPAPLLEEPEGDDE